MFSRGSETQDLEPPGEAKATGWFFRKMMSCVLWGASLVLPAAYAGYDQKIQQWSEGKLEHHPLDVFRLLEQEPGRAALVQQSRVDVDPVEGFIWVTDKDTDGKWFRHGFKATSQNAGIIADRFLYYTVDKEFRFIDLSRYRSWMQTKKSVPIFTAQTQSVGDLEEILEARARSKVFAADFEDFLKRSSEVFSMVFDGLANSLDPSAFGDLSEQANWAVEQIDGIVQNSAGLDLHKTSRPITMKMALSVPELSNFAKQGRSGVVEAPFFKAIEESTSALKQDRSVNFGLRRFSARLFLPNEEGVDHILRGIGLVTHKFPVRSWRWPVAFLTGVIVGYSLPPEVGAHLSDILEFTTDLLGDGAVGILNKGNELWSYSALTFQKTFNFNIQELRASPQATITAVGAVLAGLFGSAGLIHFGVGAKAVYKEAVLNRWRASGGFWKNWAQFENRNFQELLHLNSEIEQKRNLQFGLVSNVSQKFSDTEIDEVVQRIERDNLTWFERLFKSNRPKKELVEIKTPIQTVMHFLFGHASIKRTFDWVIPGYSRLAFYSMLVVRPRSLILHWRYPNLLETFINRDHRALPSLSGGALTRIAARLKSEELKDAEAKYAQLELQLHEFVSQMVFSTLFDGAKDLDEQLKVFKKYASGDVLLAVQELRTSNRVKFRLLYEEYMKRAVERALVTPDRALEDPGALVRALQQEHGAEIKQQIDAEMNKVFSSRRLAAKWLGKVERAWSPQTDRFAESLWKVKEQSKNPAAVLRAARNTLSRLFIEFPQQLALILLCTSSATDLLNMPILDEMFGPQSLFYANRFTLVNGWLVHSFFSLISDPWFKLQRDYRLDRRGAHDAVPFNPNMRMGPQFLHHFFKDPNNSLLKSWAYSNRINSGTLVHYLVLFSALDLIFLNRLDLDSTVVDLVLLYGIPWKAFLDKLDQSYQLSLRAIVAQVPPEMRGDSRIQSEVRAITDSKQFLFQIPFRFLTVLGEQFLDNLGSYPLENGQSRGLNRLLFGDRITNYTLDAMDVLPEGPIKHVCESIVTYEDPDYTASPQ